jgi:hypothetical protein
VTFKDDMAADLQNVFFNEGEFAESAAYHPPSGPSIPVSIIFDSIYTENEFQEAVVQGREISCQVRESQLPADYDKPKRRLNARGVMFTILSAQPNGVGVVTLVLQKG